MTTLEKVREQTWDNLTQFANDLTDDPQDKESNLHYICKEYGLNQEDLTEDMINELYEHTDCDTEVISRIIDKHWKGTYLVEYVDDRNNGYIRAILVREPRLEKQEGGLCKHPGENVAQVYDGASRLMVLPKKSATAAPECCNKPMVRYSTSISHTAYGCHIC